MSAISDTAKVERVLNRFIALPKSYSGTEIITDFSIERPFSRAWPDNCAALGLEIGSTVVSSVKLGSKTLISYVYATGAVAEAVLDLEKGMRVTAVVRLLFGTRHSEMEGYSTVEGALIVELRENNERQTPCSGNSQS